MKKFEELSRESQCAAVEVLKEVIIQSHKSRNEVDGQRLEFNAHSIREAFIALESERPVYGNGCYGSDGGHMNSGSRVEI